MKKFRIINLVLLLILSIILAIPVLAGYYAPILLEETGSIDYDMLPVMHVLDIDYLVNNSYILASGMDTRVTDGSLVAAPHMVVEDRIIFACPLDADQSKTYNFMTGGTPQAMDIVLGNGGYFYTADNAALEPGNDFNLEFKGWFDSGMILAKKTNAIVIDAGATEITATVNSAKWLSSSILPIADGTTITNTPEPALSDNYDVVSDTSDLTYIHTTNVVYQRDTFVINWPVLPAAAYNGTIEVKVYIRLANDDAARAASAKVLLYDNVTTNETLTAVANVTGTAFLERSAVLIDPDNGTWESGDFNNLEIGVEIAGELGADSALCSEVWATVSYTPTTAVLNGIYTPKSETKVELYTSAGVLKLDINDVNVENYTLNDFSVLSNASDWYWMNDGIDPDFVPYMDYIKLTQGANLRLHYQPDSIITGTTLPNEASAGLYPGVITWGANPALTTTISSLISDDQYIYNAGISPGAVQEIGSVVGGSGWTEQVGTLTTNPFYSVIKMASDNTGVPVRTIWVITSYLIIIFAMLAVFKFMPHQFLTVIVGMALNIFFIAMGTLPFWTVFVFVLMGITVIFMERTQSI